MRRSLWIAGAALASIAVLLVALGTLVAAWQDRPSVNALLVSAARELDAAREARDAGERAVLLRRVDAALTKVIHNYSDTDAAVRLATGELIGILNVDDVRRELYEAEEIYCLDAPNPGCLAQQMALYAPFLDSSILISLLTEYFETSTSYLLHVAEETRAWIAYKAAAQQFLNETSVIFNEKAALAIVSGLISAYDHDGAEQLINALADDRRNEIRAWLAIRNTDYDTALRHARRLRPELGRQTRVLRAIVEEFDAYQHLDEILYLVDHAPAPTVEIDTLLWLGNKKNDSELHWRATDLARTIEFSTVRVKSLLRIAQTTWESALVDAVVTELMTLDNPADRARYLLMLGNALNDESIIVRGVNAIREIDQRGLYFNANDIVRYLVNVGRITDAINVIDRVSSLGEHGFILPAQKSDELSLVLLNKLLESHIAIEQAREVALRVRGSLASAKAHIALGVAAVDSESVELGLRHLAAAPRTSVWILVDVAESLSRAGFREQAIQVIRTIEEKEYAARIRAMAAVARHHSDRRLFLQAVGLVPQVPREQRAFAYGELARTMIHLPARGPY